jgi:hypothetical protein
MENKLSKQELHNLAMNIVGSDLEDQGYEFLGIKSQLKTNPQFVALKEKKLHFVIVRAILYPDNPGEYDPKLANKVRDHAIKYNARTFYAGVGLANSTDYEKPIFKDEEYVINYSGLQEIE